MNHHVYRHYATDGALLYVGLTCNPKTRPYVRTKRPWLDDTVRVEVSDAMDELAARNAERAAIRDEHPLYNVHVNNGNITDAYRRWEDVADAMTDEDWARADADATAVISAVLSARATS